MLFVLRIQSDCHHVHLIMYVSNWVCFMIPNVMCSRMFSNYLVYKTIDFVLFVLVYHSTEWIELPDLEDTMQNGSDARLCLEHCKWLGSAPRSRKQKLVLKFVSQRDKALATIVLSVDPSVLYLIGDLEDPVVVWKKLSDQFQKKTWGNTSWC